MRAYDLLVTTNAKTGEKRFFIDGLRVSEISYRELSRDATRFDCFHGRQQGGVSRQWCCAYLEN